jgi:SNF2 family DNA or RNA helicase
MGTLSLQLPVLGYWRGRSTPFAFLITPSSVLQKLDSELERFEAPFSYTASTHGTEQQTENTRVLNAPHLYFT